ncbi:hypothetical protein TNCT_349231 [Trichonephila clavata]|uniref:Uncharacterized protein n=1 Tax=Trichonephila clavata TaxID=2740835 RepID=A0A8X6I0R3_TRICU|nr:hypothetical protein TNCT_349231 [Trichonephila clavata]
MVLGVPLQQCGAALVAHILLFLVVLNCRLTSGARNWMRPVPSHDLPVLDLIEPKDKRYDPKPEDLSPRPLRERLDRDFDKQFMSETRPLESILHPNGTVEFSFKRTKRGKLIPSSKMPKEIRHLRLHALKLPDGSRFRMKVGKKMRRFHKRLSCRRTYLNLVIRKLSSHCKLFSQHICPEVNKPSIFSYISLRFTICTVWTLFNLP